MLTGKFQPLKGKHYRMGTPRMAGTLKQVQRNKEYPGFNKQKGYGKGLSTISKLLSQSI